MGFRLRAAAVARYVSAVQTVILGSERFDCLPALLDRDPGGTPVVYVPTAADVLDDQAYVQEEMHRLAGMGFQITVLPLAGASRARVAAQLGHAGLVFVTGGNTVEGARASHHQGDGTGLLLGARALRRSGPGGAAPPPAGRTAATPGRPGHRCAADCRPRIAPERHSRCAVIRATGDQRS